MKQTLLTLIGLLLSWMGVQAQVISSYKFEASMGTYEELTGATVLNTSALEGDALSSQVFGADGTAVSSSGDLAGIDIGFTFNYNQKAMTKFVVYTNGAIQLGDGDISINPYGYYNNFSNASNFLGICGIRDITNSADAEISYKVVGEAPNRQLIVQWKNVVNKMAWWGEGDYLIKNQQIKLNEADGKIIFCFGQWTPTESMSSGNFKIGLGGENEDFLLLNGTYEAPTTNYKNSTSAINTTTDVYPTSGLTYTFSQPDPCVAPIAQPTELALEASSSEINGSFVVSESADHYLVLCSTQPISATPADGVSYAAGDEIDGAQVLEYTDGNIFSLSRDLAGSTTYYFAVFAANSRCLNGPSYLLASPLKGEVKTKPGAPGPLTAEATDLTVVKVTATANSSGQKVVIAQSDQAGLNSIGQMLESGAFGTPSGALSVGDEIEGGGKVIFVGIPTDPIVIEGLKENSAYFFRSWSVDDDNNYSTDVSDIITATGGTVPYVPDFSQFSPYNYEYLPGWEGEGDFFIQEDKDGTKFLQAQASSPDPDQGTILQTATPWIQLAEGTNRISFDLNMESPGWWTSPYVWNMDDVFQVAVSEDGENYTTILNVNDDNAPKFDDGSVNYTVVFDECAGKKVKIRLQFKIFGRMNAKFYNFTVEEKKPVDYPIELAASEIVGSKATIVWKSQNSPAETNWDLRFKKSDENEWSEPISVSGEPTYQLTDLVGLCSYDVQVRAISGELISDWSKTLTFTSGISIPFEDTFASGNIAGWTSMTGELKEEGTELSNSSSWNYNSRNGMIFSTYMSEVDEWLISPTLDLGDGSKSYTINYDFGNIYGSNDGQNIKYQIVVSKDNGLTWSSNDVLATFTGEDIPTEPVESTVYSANLKGFTGNVKVAFYIHAQSNDIDYLRVNKIAVVENEEETGAAFNVTYAIQEGETHPSGDVVPVAVDGKEVATLTFGEAGGADFKEGKANDAIDGFVAFTEGNGENGNKAGGTFYTITPKYDGHITIGVVLNAGKQFYVLEDGTALPDYDGITVESKYYGTYDFDVTADKSYKFYCSGSKLGFYGFNFKGTMGEVPEPEPIYIETDLTSQFASLTDWTNWIGATGYATWAAPQVTTNAGQTVYMCERYNETCENTGDVFYQNLTGLTPGTYKIELYGSAAYTFGRGFDSGYFRPEDTAEDPLTSNTGVSLYAETSNGTVSQEIAIYKATSFSEVSTATLDNVNVGEDGIVKLGMSKSTNYTNWHIVQLKGVTAMVKATDLWANYIAQATALASQPMNGEVLSALQAAMVDDAAFTTAEEYQAAIATLDAAMQAAIASIDLYKATADALSTFGEKAATLDEAGQAAYDVSEIQAEYDNRTLTEDKSSAIKAAYVTAVKAQTTPGSDYTDAGSTAVSDWIGSTGAYQTIYAERFGEEMGEGEIMYQRVEGLQPGTYNVELYAVASQAWNSAAIGNDITVAYANDATYGIEVIAQVACDPTQSIVSLDATVGEDGVLQYGMKNLTNGGNWFVVQLKSITLTLLEKDAIEAVENKNIPDGTVYNLNGQKVTTPSRGIYIINGKKRLVK